MFFPPKKAGESNMNRGMTSDQSFHYRIQANQGFSTAALTCGSDNAP